MVRNTCGFLLFILSFFNLKSQNTYLDSIQNQLFASKSDTSKCKIYNQLSQYYLSINFDSALYYANKSLIILKESNHEELKIEAEILLSKSFRAKGELKRALDIITSTLWIKGVGNLKQKADLNYESGHLLKLMGKNDSSIVYFKKAFEINKSLKDTIAMYESLAEMSNLYLDFGQNAVALDNLHQVLLLSEAIQNKRLMCDANNYIARVYTFNEDYELAKKYFIKSYELSLELKDSVDQEKTLNNIGYVLNKQGDSEKALAYFFKGIHLQSTQKDPCTTAYPFYNIGSIHRLNSLYDSSFYYLDKAVNGAISCNDKYLEALSKIDMGLLYYSQNKLYKAEKILQNALNIASSSMLAGERREALKALSVTKEKLGNSKEALRLYKEYELIKDSLYNKENVRKLTRMEADYEFKKQKKEAELINKVKDLENQKELYVAIWTRNTFILGFFLMIIIAVLIYRNFLRKRNANEVLNKLNLEILEQKEELMLRTEELKSANEEIACINESLEDRIKHRTRVIANQNNKIVNYVHYNSHQVRGPLARILGLTLLLEKKAIGEEELESVLIQIHNSAQELDDMVKKMTQKLEKERQNIVK